MYMKRKIFSIFALICGSLFLLPGALAHVPYFEHRDFSVQQPFQ